MNAPNEYQDSLQKFCQTSLNDVSAYRNNQALGHMNALANNFMLVKNLLGDSIFNTLANRGKHYKKALELVNQAEIMEQNGVRPDMQVPTQQPQTTNGSYRTGSYVPPAGTTTPQQGSFVIQAVPSGNSNTIMMMPNNQNQAPANQVELQQMLNILQAMQRENPNNPQINQEIQRIKQILAR